MTIFKTTLDSAIVNVTKAIGSLDEAINHHEAQAQRAVDEVERLSALADAQELVVATESNKAKRAARIKLRLADLLA